MLSSVRMVLLRTSDVTVYILYLQNYFSTTVFLSEM